MARVAAGWSFVPVGMILTACFSKPPGPMATGDGSGSDAGTDAGPPDPRRDAAPGCTLVEHFEASTNGPEECGPWAVQSTGGSGTVSRANDELRLGATSNTGATATCASVQAHPFGTVTLRMRPAVGIGVHTLVTTTFNVDAELAVDFTSDSSATNGTIDVITALGTSEYGSYDGTFQYLRIERYGAERVVVSLADASQTWFVQREYVTNAPSLETARISVMLVAPAGPFVGAALIDSIEACMRP